MFRALASVLAVAVVSYAGAAHASEPTFPKQPLAAQEREALLDGHIVSRPLRFEQGLRGYYVGGVSYQVVDVSPAEVMAALMNLETLPKVLPQTKRATLVETSGSRSRVELVQGGGMFEASYTVFLELSESRDEIRFWMDRSRPHDVKDVWGYFRVRPFGPNRTLVTVGAVLDLGPGIVRMLFEDSIQRIILGAPWSIKSYVEPRALASAR